MPDAVAQMRAEFGRDAVILQTRRVREPGIWGLLGRRRVEVLAALEPASTRERGPREEKDGSADGVGGKLRVPGKQRSDSSLSRGGLAAFFDVLGENLVALGIAAAEADDIVAEMGREAANGANIDPTGGGEGWKILLTDLVARRLRAIEPWTLDSPPHYHALIGPTGVGKTTTVAKLAANYALIYQKRVGFIATDTFRIGAVAQLQQYADLLDAPLAVVRTPGEMMAAVQQMEDMDLVLIDTVGGSQRDAARLGEIQGLLRAVPGLEAHLVVSATTRVADLEDIVRRFSQLNFSTVVVTKNDETTCPATVYNAARLADRPLSFLTAGQAVPEDIEVVRPLNVARSIVAEVERRLHAGRLNVSVGS